MSRFRHWLVVGIIAVAISTAGGCAFGRKPYSHDPLFQSRRAVWGKGQVGEFIPPEPIAPPAPTAPLIGSEVISRP